MYHMDWFAYIKSILASQWWISLDYYNEWSFKCAAELSLVVFYWEALHLCIRDIAFRFFSISLSSLFLFWYWCKYKAGLIVHLQVFFLLSFFGKSLRIGINSSVNVCLIYQWSSLVLGFSSLGDILLLIQLPN